ncbi:MAG: efflux RND transporter periplasmic adaptor subunit [Chthonomonadales bacterium]
MKRILPIAIVLIILVGGFFYGKKLLAVAPAAAKTFKVTKAETGTVKKTVSSTGTLQPWSVVDIKSKAGGKVEKMLVDVGTVVKVNQQICTIDPTDTKLSYDQANADIKTADARINQSQLTAALQSKQSAIGVDSAKAALDAAIAGRDATAARVSTAKQQMEAQPGLTNANIDSSKANLDNNEKQLAEMKEATIPQSRATAKSNLDQANANLTNAESNLARQVNLEQQGFVSKQVVDNARANRDVAKAQVENTQRKLDTLGRELAASLAAMEARVSQAKAQLANTTASSADINIRKSGYLEAVASLKQADQQVNTAKDNLRLAKENMQNVPIRQSDVVSAQASRMRAQAGLVNAKATLDQTTVTAPTAGVILKKYVEQGTIISSALSFAATGNNIVQIGDVTKMYVDVTVDETDISNVDVGQKVDIAIEAYSTMPFEGKVTRIDPQAVVEQNVTNIHVRVEIDNTDTKFQLLKPGMNATCEFVKDKKDNVVMVPNEAMHTDDNGKAYVEIGVGGKPVVIDPKDKNPPDAGSLVDVKVTKREVEAGLEGNENTEIKSGLKDGDTIVVSSTEPVVQQAGGAMGGSGRMGGFGGKK